MIVSLVGSVMRAVSGRSSTGYRNESASSDACSSSFSTRSAPSRIARTTGPSIHTNSLPRGTQCPRSSLAGISCVSVIAYVSPPRPPAWIAQCVLPTPGGPYR